MPIASTAPRFTCSSINGLNTVSTYERQVTASVIGIFGAMMFAFGTPRFTA